MGDISFKEKNIIRVNFQSAENLMQVKITI